jgi:hypothetical protein
MTLANERRAQRAARTRFMRDARRTPKDRLTTEEKDAVRADKGKSTLVNLRNGLPSYTYARKQATHIDVNDSKRCFVQSVDDPCLFGCALRFKDAQPPRGGDRVTLTAKATSVTAVYFVAECTAISDRMFQVALNPVA